MTDSYTSHESPAKTPPYSMGLLALAVLLVSFGVTMFLFSAAYVQDLQTLARAPELVWAFICGRPSEFGPVLPLLLTLATMSLLGSIVALGWRWWRGRAHAG